MNELASATGTPEVPAAKLGRGYRYVHDKWTLAGLTPQPSTLVRPTRIAECPIQMECTLVKAHELMSDVPSFQGRMLALELTVRRVHVLPELQMCGHPNRVDPDRVRPLIMSFQQLYALAPGKVGKSGPGENPGRRLPCAAGGSRGQARVRTPGGGGGGGGGTRRASEWS